ncbi:MAG: hypothetical protein AAGE52_35230 [Myxococcota bacterium]
MKRKQLASELLQLACRIGCGRGLVHLLDQTQRELELCELSTLRVGRDGVKTIEAVGTDT